MNNARHTNASVAGTSSTKSSEAAEPIFSPHAVSIKTVFDVLNSSLHGLSHSEAKDRLEQFGTNTLPQVKMPGLGTIFLHQFKSPLIYVLVAAALLSLLIREFSDAGFISAVLFINAVIGTTMEYSAQRAATALQDLVNTGCRILRENETCEINADELVPGDIVLLQSGDKVPADLRLFESFDLKVDESLLTGESLPVQKNSDAVLTADSVLGDRVNSRYHHNTGWSCWH